MRLNRNTRRSPSKLRKLARIRQKWDRARFMVMTFDELLARLEALSYPPLDDSDRSV